MASNGPIAGACGRESRLYERYTAAATELLSADGALSEAEREWARYVRRSHGDVFDRMGLDRPRETLFVDLLYFDFVVDRLRRAAERAFGVRLGNPDPTASADALGFAFGDLHERVVDADGPDCARDA
ncbi:MAG: hypothetical protein ABEK02_02550, partial [Haloquadratum sp.]